MMQINILYKYRDYGNSAHSYITAEHEEKMETLQKTLKNAGILFFDNYDYEERGYKKYSIHRYYIFPKNKDEAGAIKNFLECLGINFQVVDE